MNTKNSAMKTKKNAANNTKSKKRSAEVIQNSDARDLKENIFDSKNAKKIAQSLKHSAEESKRRKSSPYRSAMSMLSFYINRAGKNLDPDQKEVEENAKEELRKGIRA